MTSEPASDRSSSRSTLLGRLSRIPTPAIFVFSIILALVVLWLQGSIGEVVRVMRTADPGLTVLATILYIATLWLLCYRWHLLVRMAQGHSDLPRASEAFLTSVVINYAAPIGLAVPSRAALTKRALGLDAHATGTIALWEIGLDVIVLGAATVVWMILADGSLGELRQSVANSAGLYALAAAVAAIALIGVVAWLWRKPILRQRVIRGARRVVLAPRERPTIAALALSTTIIYWISQGFVLALLLRALDVRISFEFLLGLTSLPILVGMLSPIPGGAVVREALMYAVARLANAPADEVLAAAVIYRIALFAAIPVLYIVTRLWISLRSNPPPSRSNDHAGSIPTSGP